GLANDLGAVWRPEGAKHGRGVADGARSCAPIRGHNRHASIFRATHGAPVDQEVERIWRPSKAHVAVIVDGVVIALVKERRDLAAFEIKNFDLAAVGNKRDLGAVGRERW